MTAEEYWGYVEGVLTRAAQAAKRRDADAIMKMTAKMELHDDEGKPVTVSFFELYPYELSKQGKSVPMISGPSDIGAALDVLTMLEALEAL